MTNRFLLAVCIIASFIPLSLFAGTDTTMKPGLILPAGFSSTVFHDSLGKARHLTVAPNGDVYVKLDRLKDGKGIIRLVDANKDGVAETATG
ncbi:MAG TPA: hypothetical protein VLA58_07910, partial [Chitinophagaceae bacterium]|nr:hypothetical protein [Chitinophagaceae bacterium]